MHSSRFSSDEAVAITRPAPIGLAELHRQRPDAAGAGDHEHRLAAAGRDPRAGPVEVPGGQALDQQRERRAVVEAVGDREDAVGRRERVLGVAAVAGQRDHALAGVGPHARDLAAGDQRQVLLLDVAVLALVGVGEVDPGAATWIRTWSLAGLRDGKVDELQDLRAAELALLDGTHRAAPYPRDGLASRAV